MALFQIAENSTEIAKEVVLGFGKIGLWLQAIGILVILTIITMVVNFLINKKRLKELKKIKTKINSIENKLDEVLKKTK